MLCNLLHGFWNLLNNYTYLYHMFCHRNIFYIVNYYSNFLSYVMLVYIFFIFKNKTTFEFFFYLNEQNRTVQNISLNEINLLVFCWIFFVSFKIFVDHFYCTMDNNKVHFYLEQQLSLSTIYGTTSYIDQRCIVPVLQTVFK